MPAGNQCDMKENVYVCFGSFNSNELTTRGLFSIFRPLKRPCGIELFQSTSHHRALWFLWGKQDVGIRLDSTALCVCVRMCVRRMSLSVYLWSASLTFPVSLNMLMSACLLLVGLYTFTLDCVWVCVAHRALSICVFLNFHNPPFSDSPLPCKCRIRSWLNGGTAEANFILDWMSWRQ